MKATLSGIVEHGKQLGRQLGYPTANLALDSLVGSIPSSGVYAARCTLQNQQTFWAMVNVGYRPTVDGDVHRLSVEAHLLNYDGDLYGQTLQLELCHFIREERKMASLEELKCQLTHDLAAVRGMSSSPQ